MKCSACGEKMRTKGEYCIKCKLDIVVRLETTMKNEVRICDTELIKEFNINK